MKYFSNCCGLLIENLYTPENHGNSIMLMKSLLPIVLSCPTACEAEEHLLASDH